MNPIVKDSLELGRRYFENREYDKAEKYLTEAVKAGDKFADVHNMLGMIYYERGEFKEARREFMRALELNPSYTEAGLNLALTCNDLGMYAEGMEAFQSAVASRHGRPVGLDPYVKGKLANLYAAAGDLYSAAGRYEQAVEEYERALSLCPHYVDIWNKLGCTWRDAGKYEKAVETFYRAMQSTGGRYTPLHLNLGVTYYAMGRTEEALRHWKSVLKTDPSNEKARLYCRMVENKAKR